MSEPLFTIGIPTFNRAIYLEKALEAALNQSYANLQIVVSDNASNDNTEEVVRNFNDSRIAYFRNERNLGPSANFARAVDLAEGKYFSWLQDDDLIFANFVSRAIELLTQYDSSLYLGVAIRSPTRHSLSSPELYCPPVPMNWQERKPAIIDRNCFAALSLFVSVSIPPVAAFATHVLRTQAASLRETTFPLLSERTILLNAVGDKGAICDPTVCGLYLLHQDQMWSDLISQSGRLEKEWELMASFIDSIIGEVDVDFGPNLMHTFEQIPLKTLQKWYVESCRWPRHVNICNQVRPIIESVARHRVPELFKYSNGPSMRRVKRLADEIVPPFLLRWMMRKMGRSASQSA